MTSKDQNLTKAHVKHLESLLIGIAGSLGRCELVNGTAHEYGSGLPESDRADMAFFLEQIRTVLPVLGFDFLRELSKPSVQTDADKVVSVARSPRFVLEVPRHHINACGQEIDGEFFVLKGSKARASWTGVEGGYQNLFRQLVAEGVLVAAGEHLVFGDDYAFSSPSAAAAVVCGRSANGRTSWQVEGSGQTYAAWQDLQVNGPDAAVSEDP